MWRTAAARRSSTITRARGWIPVDLGAYRIYGAPVVSPVAGTVLEAIDGHPDRPPLEIDPDSVAGNFVAIQPDGATCYILLAHLAQESVLPRQGARVQRGEPIGRVGNSALDRTAPSSARGRPCRGVPAWRPRRAPAD
jgi:murein DD-endopeptidase MepM/ murein hydrolase activator NlpD